jgi:hypothetical protein
MRVEGWDFIVRYAGGKRKSVVTRRQNSSRFAGFLNSGL